MKGGGTMEKEKVRLNEMGPEDFEDPEGRELMNELIRTINRSNERLEQFEEGKISLAEMGKLRREDDKFTREINRRIKEYKKNKERR
jgi:hypothetical protein